MFKCGTGMLRHLADESNCLSQKAQKGKDPVLDSLWLVPPSLLSESHSMLDV